MEKANRIRKFDRIFPFSRSAQGDVPMAARAVSVVLPVTTSRSKRSRTRVARSTRTHLTPEEILATLKIARARSARDWCMVLLAYRHGLRASEVCNLRLADIDLKRQSIIVRRLKGSLETTQPLYP